ncbi:hypothetical protein M433DRAFT_343062 [Acidomyces richmondensis BFW]|nr:MAG: hypothetical protein FE78DRAFT_480952 [Acidomyces sp. 'richmondensis']KYG43627.1 hypothetical protein M433DRAFT_343062 [Acidomyces richmondensis BFW]
MLFRSINSAGVACSGYLIFVRVVGRWLMHGSLRLKLTVMRHARQHDMSIYPAIFVVAASGFDLALHVRWQLHVFSNRRGNRDYTQSADR